MFTRRNLTRLQICCIVFFCSCFTSTIFAQKGEDPFAGNYMLGKRAQLYLMYRQGSFPTSSRYDFDIPNKTITGTSLHYDSWGDDYAFDVCAGDFTGNGLDEAVQATVSDTLPANSNSGEVLLRVSGKWVPFDVGKANIGAGSGALPNPNPNVRLVAGNFCGNGKKEFVLAYWGADKYIHLNLYGLDSSKTIHELATVQEPLNPDLGSEALFDIAAGDFDGDGRDEIVLVKNNAWIVPDSTNHPNDATISLSILIYAYNSNDSTLTVKQTMSVARTHAYEFQNTRPYAYRTYVHLLTRLSVAAGNLQGDSRDEFVVGYSVEAAYREDYNPIFWWIHEQQLEELFPYLLTFDNKAPDTAGGFQFEDALKTQDPNNPNLELPPSVGPWFAWSDMNDPNNSTDFPFTLLCANLDGGSYDQIICSGDDQINVIPDEKQFFTGGPVESISGFQWRYLSPLRWSQGGVDRQFAVMDLDADTSSCTDTSTGWLPELVVCDCKTFWKAEDYSEFNTREMRISVWGVTKQGDLSSLSSKDVWTNLEQFSTNGGYSMALGDFKGEGLRLGKPRSFERDSVIQPLMVLCTPPIHYDILNDTTFDVCQAFNGNTSPFYSEYSLQNSTQSIVQTTFHRGWGVSASLTSTAIAAGNGVKLTLARHYGYGFSKVNTNEKTLTVSTCTKADLDDEVLAADVKYKMWEYPVYYWNKLLGHVLVADPTYYGQVPPCSWYEGQDWSNPSYVTDHEVGNILSYTAPVDSTDSLQINALNTTFSVGPFTNYSLEVSQAEIKSSQMMQSNEFGFSSDFFAETGFQGDMEVSGDPCGIGVAVTFPVDFGFEFDKSDVYDQQAIQTATTTISKTWQIDVNMGKTIPVAGIEYDVKPYVYWSRNGALILDYVVNPRGAWWQLHYGSKPDPAFNLPYLYWTQEGEEFTPGHEYQRYETKDIFLHPTSPAPGDTVEILTRVHNYSLCRIPLTDTVTVRYYLGDPDAGGKEITDLLETGQTMSPKYNVRAPRGETYFYAKWVIPKDISPDTRLYAVIDPDNKIDEIHENNNKGYVQLFPGGVTSVKDVMKSEQPKEFRLSNNYPNPFNPTTRINYQIPTLSHVTIKVYDLLGQEIATLVDEVKNAGHYSVEFNASNFASGVYFYRMKAGSFVSTKKLLLLK